MHPAAKTLFKLDNDEQWLALLVRSITEPEIDGIEMPRFPHGSIQRQFVGSADVDAMNEGFVFHQHVKGYADALGIPLHSGSKFLDFGSGWGRYTRLFWNDVAWDNIYGVDIDPDMIAVCRALGLPGCYHKIDPRGTLPYEDGFFDCIVAYSVFSHLPEPIAEHWMKELSRVAKSGCIIAYTTEPRRFLDFVLEIASPAPTPWHEELARHKSLIPRLFRKFDDGKFAYLPTSGGEFRDSDVYGDACIPEEYIRRRWGKYFGLQAYVDDPAKFWQAFVVAQKK